MARVLRSNRTTPRSPWVARAALTVVALLLAVSSLAATLANVAVKVDPARAHALWPASGRITAAMARNMIAIDPELGIAREQSRLARRALRQDPTVTDALVVLAMQAQVRGDTEEARRLFGYSLQLSRRDLSSRLWGIEEAVIRGDITDALRNYDLALRTSDNAQNILFPTLASAAGVPRVRAELIELLAQRPPWLSEFITFAATEGRHPEATVLLFDDLRRIGLRVGEMENASVTNALFAKGDVEAAWRYFASYRTDDDPARSRDPTFRRDENLTPFDWQVGTEPAISASMLRNGRDGLFDFAVPGGERGTLLQQNLVLPTGRYRLAGESRGIEQPEVSRPYWSLVCNDGRQIGYVVVSDSNADGGIFGGDIVVPAGCSHQVLRLVARASQDVAGVVGQLTRAWIVPVTGVASGGRRD